MDDYSLKMTKSQRTKNKVFQSTVKLMLEKGYASTTIRDICADAGVSVGTFYSYFPSKQDVFYDVFNSADEYFHETVLRSVKGDGAREKIEDFFRYYARLNYDSGIEVMKVLYNSDNGWFVKFRPMQEALAQLIREGQESGELVSDVAAEDVVTFLFILARGCCYSWCVLDGEYDLETQLVDYTARALSTYAVKR